MDIVKQNDECEKMMSVAYRKVACNTHPIVDVNREVPNFIDIYEVYTIEQIENSFSYHDYSNYEKTEYDQTPSSHISIFDQLVKNAYFFQCEKMFFNHPIRKVW